MSTFLFENILTLFLNDIQGINSKEIYNFLFSQATNNLILLDETGFQIFHIDISSPYALKTKKVKITSGILSIPFDCYLSTLKFLDNDDLIFTTHYNSVHILNLQT